MGAKLAVTVGLLAYLLGKVAITPVLAQIGSMAPAAAVNAEIVLLSGLVLLAVRWHLVNRIVDSTMRFGQVLRLTLVGHFFNQVLPSGFAGDAVRGWLASREGVRLGPLIRSILCDRLVGLLILIVMVALTFFVLPDLFARYVPGRQMFRIAALLGLVSLAALFLGGARVAGALMRYRQAQPLAKLLRDLHRVLFSGIASACVVVLAAAVQILNVAAIVLCARGMSLQLDFGPALVVIPAIMLVSMVPISFAGWGVREGATVIGLGLLGIGTVDALAVSVAFGLLQIVLGVPGAALWLARRATPASVVRPADRG
jgi:uncharacterized membrane protein YbhN (UPF0104 family)